MTDADFAAWCAQNGHPPNECVCPMCRRLRQTDDGLRLSGRRLQAAIEQVYEMRDALHKEVNAHEATKSLVVQAAAKERTRIVARMRDMKDALCGSTHNGWAALSAAIDEIEKEGGNGQ